MALMPLGDWSWFYVPAGRRAGVSYAQIPGATGDLTMTRASVANAIARNGNLNEVAANVGRLDFLNGAFLGQPIEPLAVNQIRNPIMAGAAAGTPGTLPINWVVSLGGLTRQVVGVGVENGVEFIDLRFFGTASSVQLDYRYDGPTQIAAASGQQWTHSFFFRIIAAPQPPLSYQHQILERNSGGALLADTSTNFAATSTLTRFQVNRTLNNANTAFVQPQIRHGLTIGQSYDFTIRIGLPQMELGAVATSPIRSNGTATTRQADVFTRTGASGMIGQTEGTIYVEADLINTPVVPFTRGILIIDNGTLNRDNCVDIRQNSAGQVAFVTRVAGFNTSTLTSSAVSGLCKIAISYSVVQCELYVNGTRIGTGAVPSSLPAALSAIRLGYNFASQGIFELNDRIRAVGISRRRWSNAELENLTRL